MKLLRLLRKSSCILVITLVLLSIILSVIFLPGTARGLPEATTLDATNVTANSATLNGQTHSVGSAVVYFEYGLTTAYGSSTSTQMGSGSPFTFNADISGLSPGTTYHFRVVKLPDNGGGSFYAGDKTFTTGVASAPTQSDGDYDYIWPEVITIGADDVSGSSAVVIGNLTSIGSASKVRVYFKYGTHYYQTIWPLWAGGKVTEYQVQTAPGEFSANINNLNPGTTYYFRAMAYGEGIGRGVVKSFTTP